MTIVAAAASAAYLCREAFVPAVEVGRGLSWEAEKGVFFFFLIVGSLRFVPFRFNAKIGV